MNMHIKIKEIRKLHKFTQKQVSDHLQIAERSYQSIEYGKSKPTIENLIKLADYFDVSTDYLLGRTDNPNSHKL